MANGSIAQLGEHLPYKQRVTGSSPVVPTNYFVTGKEICLSTIIIILHSRRAELEKFEVIFFNGRVVQLVRTLACHARGRGFEPHPGRHILPLKKFKGKKIRLGSSVGRARD